MNKKIVFLLGLLCPVAFIFAAEQEQAQAEQKESAQQAIVQGRLYLSILKDSLINMYELKKSTPLHSLALHECFGPLNDNEPLASVQLRIEKSNHETEWWSFDLPILKPIAISSQQQAVIQREIDTVFFLPRGISALMSSYAQEKVSLLDFADGLQIMLHIPYKNENFPASITCHASYLDFKPFELKLRKRLIAAHEIQDIVLESVLLQRIKAELEILEKREAEKETRR